MQINPMVRRQKPEKQGFMWICVPMILVILIQTVVSFIVTEVYAIAKFSGNPNMTVEELYEVLLALTSDAKFNGVILFCYALVTSIFFFRWYKKEFLDRKKEKGWSAQMKMFAGYDYRYLLPGLLLGVPALQYGAVYLMKVISIINPNLMTAYLRILENAGLNGIHTEPILLAYAVLVGPIAEELTFRGLTYGFARRNMGFWGANIAQAMLFGYFHGNILQGLMAFALGLVLGYIMEKTDNLLLIILLHIGFNGFSIFLKSLIYYGNNMFGFYFSVFFGLAGTYFAVLLITKGAAKKKEVSKDEGVRQ